MSLVTQVLSSLVLALVVAGCTPSPELEGARAEAAPLPVSASGSAAKPVRLIAVGDLMLGTSIKQQILDKGPAYPFQKYRDMLTDADLTFGNLETPLSDRGAPMAGKSQESLDDKTNFIFRAPPVAADGLAEVGFDVVSVANNHTMDYGPIALRDTLGALREAKVEAVGAGENLDEAYQPVFLKRKGQRLAFFAISDILPPFSAATQSKPGVAPARGAGFEKRMKAAIKEARTQSDWVLISVHWGKELYAGATLKQKLLGHKLVDWGADAVIGAHTHCLGPVETYHGSVIHYSLGNFIARVGYRKNVAAWELTFKPGERPAERSLTFDWNGDAVASR